MYGLVVKLSSAPGRRTDLITMMGGEDSHTVPGCLSFIVSEDAADGDVLWITEVWESRAAHEASLKTPAIETGLADAETLIAGYEKATTRPVARSSGPWHGKR